MEVLEYPYGCVMLAQEVAMVTRAQIEEVLLRTDNVGMHAVGRALVHLRNRQLGIELKLKDTIARNGRGFTPADAFIGTKMADDYENRKYLTKKQVAYWQRAANPENPNSKPRIIKYAEQLLEEAKLKEYEKSQKA